MQRLRDDSTVCENTLSKIQDQEISHIRKEEKRNRAIEKGRMARDQQRKKITNKHTQRT